MGAITPVYLVGASIGLGLPIAVGIGNVAGMLDFLIDTVLQKCVKLLNFGFDLGDVRQFDFDGGTEAVTAELGQPELFAVICAEFDGHNIGCVGGGL